MKVKITYTVDLGEVLSEVNGLCDKANSLVGEVRSSWPTPATDENLTEQVSSVDRLRKKLLHVDLLLADVDGILRSYMETKFGKDQKENTKEILNG